MTGVPTAPKLSAKFHELTFCVSPLIRDSVWVTHKTRCQFQMRWIWLNHAKLGKTIPLFLQNERQLYDVTADKIPAGGPAVFNTPKTIITSFLRQQSRCTNARRALKNNAGFIVSNVPGVQPEFRQGCRRRKSSWGKEAMWNPSKRERRSRVSPRATNTREGGAEGTTYLSSTGFQLLVLQSSWCCATLPRLGGEDVLWNGASHMPAASISIVLALQLPSFIDPYNQSAPPDTHMLALLYNYTWSPSYLRKALRSIQYRQGSAFCQ